eukprot:236864_1
MGATCCACQCNLYPCGGHKESPTETNKGISSSNNEIQKIDKATSLSSQQSLPKEQNGKTHTIQQNNNNQQQKNGENNENIKSSLEEQQKNNKNDSIKPKTISLPNNNNNEDDDEDETAPLNSPKNKTSKTPSTRSKQRKETVDSESDNDHDNEKENGIILQHPILNDMQQSESEPINGSHHNKPPPPINSGEVSTSTAIIKKDNDIEEVVTPLSYTQSKGKELGNSLMSIN